MSDIQGSADLASILELVLQGDTQAESALLEHFAPRVRVMALARVRNPDLARDLTQETLVAVLQAARRGQIRDHARVAAFVHGVARNIINNHLRRSRDHPELELDENIEELLTADDRSTVERRHLLRRALQNLPAADRQVLLLTLVEGLTPSEIATRIGVSAEAARTRKTRALKRVLDAMADLSRVASPYHTTKGTDSP